MQVPVNLWTRDGNSPAFQPILSALYFYATQLEATNDPAERALKLVKDTVGKYHTEENIQHGLVTVVEERKLAKASKDGHISMQSLKGIVRPRNIGNSKFTVGFINLCFGLTRSSRCFQIYLFICDQTHFRQRKLTY